MRTTLTIDDDVAVMLENIQSSQRISFRKIVNLALRKCLTQWLSEANPEVGDFRVVPFQAGGALLPNLDMISDVLAVAENEDHR